MSRDDFRRDMEAWLASEQANEAAEYAARGRKHQSLSIDDLIAAWVQAFRRLAAKFQDGNLRIAEVDLRSELLLRNIDPPYDLVKDELGRLTNAAADAIEELQLEDPGHFDRVNEEIENDVATFRAERENKS
ncbi:hypothetical protein [Bradyrhizobium sp. 27S5]|uniref:hypothetical protein n=1 Tax=Bradyrhizobium sp. 27S5 TaxID=3139728 RepID=UPI0030D53C02